MVWPSGGSTGVPVTERVIVEFSEPIDPALVGIDPAVLRGLSTGSAVPGRSGFSPSLQDRSDDVDPPGCCRL
jgi:hypothetical protein